jgi:hypothetical protein
VSAAAVDSPELARWQRGALLAGAIGLAACAVAGLVPDTRAQFFRSYLLAFNLVLGLALGAMAVVMIQYLTGGVWGYLMRRPLEAATRTMPLVAVLFLPLLLGLYDLYGPPWLGGDLGDRTRYYLNLPFFLARAGVYFVVWLALAWVLNSWSLRMDRTNDPRLALNLQRLGAGGLLLYGATITFASVDWVMSLEAPWSSTIYGGMFGMGQVLSAFAFALAVLTLLGDRPPLAGLMSGLNLRDLGSLLLAFVMVWAYLAFSQYILIYAGNLPEENLWYVRRTTRGWGYIGALLVLLYFALPFALLLSADVKRHRRRLAAIAVLVVAMRVVDLFWLIMPARANRELPPPLADRLFSLATLVDVAAVVGVGGVWLGVYLWQLRTWPLLPAHAPELGEGNHHA